MIVTIEFIFKTLEYAGLINLDRFTTKRRATLQRIHVAVQSVLWLIYLFTHNFNTLTRATRYFPEFCQVLLEDLVGLEVVIIAFHLSCSTRKLNRLIDYERNVFARDKEILPEAQRHGNFTHFAVFTGIAAATLGANMEALLPTDPAELEIRRLTYRTAHPERRHPVPLRFPFLDESESWTYEAVFVYILYMDTVFVFATNAIITFLPVAIIHLRAQYEILSKFLAKLGEEHTDAEGNRIFYTDFTRNECQVDPRERSAGPRSQDARLRKQYEKCCLKQIVQYHIQLLRFQDELLELWSPVMFVFIIANNFMFCLCLYQMVLSPTALSPMRYLKFSGEIAAVAMAYFLLCNASEILDDGNASMERAVLNCAWHKCSVDTRRDLCLILRRLHRRNHLRFYNGAVVLGRRFFLGVLRLTYSFFNFMRLRGAVH